MLAVVLTPRGEGSCTCARGGLRTALTIPRRARAGVGVESRGGGWLRRGRGGARERAPIVPYVVQEERRVVVDDDAG